MRIKLFLPLVIFLVVLIGAPVSSQSPAAAEPLPGQYLTSAQSGDPFDIAINHIEQNLNGLALQSADLNDYLITDQYTSKRSGTTHIYLQQRVAGIEVTTGRMNTNIAADGSVMNLHSSFIGNAAAATNIDTPTLSAVDAVSVAVAELGLTVDEPLRVINSSRAANQETLISDGGIARNPIPAKLMYHPTHSGDLRLAWEMEIFERAAQHYWIMLIDATTGDLLSHEDAVIHEDFDAQAAEAHGERLANVEYGIATAPTPFDKYGQPLDGTAKTASTTAAPPASYKVYPLPFIDPNDTDGMAQINAINPADAAENASPKGWHDITDIEQPDTSLPITQGNNVFAYADQAAGGVGVPAPATNPLNLEFHHEILVLAVPSTYPNASVTNLFYWNNMNHDIHYQYGFDEVSGNLQVNTYGRGGAGNDLVLAQAQDSGGTNNANQLTLADGLPAQMQMYLGVNTSGGLLRDGSLDNPVIIHEYGHSVSTRLTGGPATSCLSGDEQGGEGWGDWWGMAFTHKVGDTGDMPRGVGQWLFGQDADGPGIRQRPYTTDFNINEQTYDNIISGPSVPHGVGSIWATMLWEVYWELVNEHGFNPDLYDADATEGNIIALNIVMEGLKLQPCGPTFVDMRDGVLLAEQSLYGGANQCLVWSAFARRGLGVSASDGGTNGRADGSEAFDLPSFCTDPNAIVGITPPTQSTCVPNSAEFNVFLSPTAGFTGNAALTLSGAPSGYSGNFAPAMVAVPGESTLTFTNSGTATPGSYEFTVTATANASVQAASATLNVYTAAPTAPALTTPANNATEVSLKPTFTWAAVAQADKYRLEVASDSAFNDIVYHNEPLVTSDTPPGSFFLDSNTRYYWRVTALNACGEGIASTVNTFVTLTAFCSFPEAPLPISILPVTDSITIGANETITDLDVSLNVIHSWVGDLTIALTHDDTNTTITLVDRPGHPFDDPADGCDGSNIITDLDDDASNSVEDSCDDVSGLTNGPYAPDMALSAFNGQDLAGSWTLSIIDNIPAVDDGTLVQWCLLPPTSTPPTAVTVSQVDATPSLTGLLVVALLTLTATLVVVGYRRTT